MKIINIIAVILLAVIAFGVWFVYPTSDAPMGAMDYTLVFDGVRNYSTTTIGTSPTLLSASSSARMLFNVCYPIASSTDFVFIHLAAATTSLTASTSVQANEGYLLTTGDCFNIPRDTGFYYSGKIFGISTATSTLSIMEK